MFKDITLGQYYAVDSFVHSMDSRVKLLLTIVYIVVAMFAAGVWGYGLLAAFMLIGILASRVPVRTVLRSLRPLRFILIFTFVLNLFFTSGGEPLVTFWIVRITDAGLSQAISMALRLVFLIGGTSIMTLTTAPVDLTDGLESILSPLKIFKFPAHELAMMMTIALRFIPILLEEADKIRKAQMARGADFETGNLLERAKRLMPLLVPLFFSAFRRADELAMAMEARCYHGGEGRTRLKVLRCTWRDLVAALALGAFGTAIIWLHYRQG